MKSDNLYPLAQALAAVKHGGRVHMAEMSMEEEVGYLAIAAAVRRLIDGR